MEKGKLNHDSPNKKEEVMPLTTCFFLKKIYN